MAIRMLPASQPPQVPLRILNNTVTGNATGCYYVVYRGASSIEYAALSYLGNNGFPLHTNYM